MHPRIKEIIDKLHLKNSDTKLNKSTLEFLKSIGVTQTEAIVSIHLDLKLPIKDVQDYVYESAIWEPEDINEIAFQTFKYL